MISFLGHVCPNADSIVSPIHSWALWAGMRIETKGGMNNFIYVETAGGFVCSKAKMPGRSIIPLHDGVQPQQSEEPAHVIKQSNEILHEKVMPQNEQKRQRQHIQRNRNE